MKQKILTAFFIYEAKRFLSKRFSIITALLIFCALVFIQMGCIKYLNSLERKEKFQVIEKQKISQFQNYRQLGTYGIRMLIVPAPISIFFSNSGVIPDMTAYVDSGERLKIYMPLKGKNIFAMVKDGMTDFSGILLFFGSLISLFYGFESFMYSEFMRNLASMAPAKHVFIYILFARALLLLLMISGLMACAMLLVFINGILLPLDTYLLLFMGIVFGVSIFFFALGAFYGTFQSKVAGFIALLCTWFVLLFVIPAAIKLYVAEKADMITPIYELEMAKLKIVMDFENRAIKKAGKFDSKMKAEDKHKDVILGYWNNELRKIYALEEEMRKQMKKNVSLFFGLSIFFPSTFYQAVNSEASSMGYLNFSEFYKYVQQNKMAFFKYFMEKSYFSNEEKVEPYFQGDENIYNGESRLVEFFAYGCLVLLLYTTGLIFLTYSGFKKRLYFKPLKKTTCAAFPPLKFNGGDFKVWSTEGDIMTSLLYTQFSGEAGLLEKKGYRPLVSIGGREILRGDKKQDFLYICHPSEIPGDIRVRDLLSLISSLMGLPVKQSAEKAAAFIGKDAAGKKFKKLTADELGRFTLAVLGMNRFSCYLVNDAARAMTAKFAVAFKARMTELSKAGALVLFLTPDIFFNSRITEPGKYFYESETWCNVVDSLDPND